MVRGFKTESRYSKEAFWNRKVTLYSEIESNPLLWAISEDDGSPNILEYLLSLQGIDLTVSEHGFTPLLNACYNGKWQAVKLLMAYPYMSREEKKAYVLKKTREIFFEKQGIAKSYIYTPSRHECPLFLKKFAIL